MSQENVETARRFSEAFERSSRAYWKNPRSLVAALQAGDLDPEGTELLSYLHPQVEWKTAFSLEGETHRGHLEFLKVCDEWLDATEDYSVTIREVTELGSDRVLVVSDLAFKAKGTGIQVNGVSCALITLREGSIVRIDEYSNRKDALEAAGLSQENVEIEDWVRSGYAWGNRERAFASDWWHPDGEYVNSREDPDHATHRGYDAIGKLEASWRDAYPDLQLHPLEVRASGDRVFVWVRFAGHGAGSGLPIDMEIAHVLTLEGGKIRRLEEFLDRAEALEAAGLKE